tara:strand:- start:231 stop:1100 length:870 start_codon:yes stop_codon:yes gene_type:complete
MTTGNSLINLGDLSQPVTVLIEKISNAIGIIYEPTKIRRNAKAEADANRTIVLADLNLQSEVEHRAMQRMLVQETRKQNNIENIIQNTVEELLDDAQVENLDEDWLANFFDRCENISNKTMQTMWSRLLTSEATKQGTISKKTINLVSNMDKEDAELFTNFCQFVWHLDRPVPIIFDIDNNEILLESNMGFIDLLHLESIGLVVLNESRQYTLFNVPKYNIYNYSKRTFEFKFSENHNNELSVGGCFLTTAGAELFHICEPQENIKYLDHIIDFYQEKGISITEITQQD